MRPIYSFLSEDAGLITKTVSGFIPSTAIVPLKKIGQDEVEILVKSGESVKEGQIIARAPDYCVHSSIPGTVENIIHSEFADGSEGYAAKINLGGTFTFTGKKQLELDWKDKDSSTICFLLKENGVVNTFSKRQPLNRQIQNIDKSKQRLLAVRLYSEDPSRITDGFVTEHYFEKIKIGSAIVAKAMNAAGILFARDINQKNLDFSIADLKIPVSDIAVDSKGYPNGFINEISEKAKTELKNTPFSNAGIRDLYIDSVTALNVYNAVVLNKGQITANVHVSGDCLNAACVIEVKVGTTLGELAKQSGGFKRPVGKIIINGKLTGNSVAAMDIPVSKGVKSVAFIPFNQLPDQKEQKCIRCGNCLKICPLNLYPESLFRCYKNKDFNDPTLELIQKTAVLCTECSLCNSVCPARLPLSQTIAKLKKGNFDEK